MSVAPNMTESGLQPGVFWYGKLPSDWRAKRLKFAVRLVSAKAAYGDSDLPYMGLEHIESWTGRYLEDEEASPDGVVSHFEPGDVLFGKLRPYLAKVHLAQHRGVCSTEALVLRASEELLPEYLRYFLVSPVTIENINSSTYGSKMPRAAWDFIGNQLQPLPPLEEQRKIAAFLDRKTAEIDTLIAKKRRLLDRLAEKRTALITHAVTKGLNPDAPMKDSGIEWLGEIPAHWEVMPVRRLAKPVKNAIKVGPFGNQLVLSEMLAGDQDVLVFNQRSVLDKNFSNNKHTISAEKFVELAAFEVFPRDLLISTRGTIGRCAVAPDSIQKGVLHPCLMRIRLDENYVLPEFLEFLVEDSPIAIEQLRLASNSTTIDVIYSNTLKAVKVPIPPIEEQEQVISAIMQYNTEIDRISEKVKFAITSLQEYRSALITNAVTGQIKVA